MKLKVLSCLIFLALFFSLKSTAATTLAAGDIAFVGYNAINGSNDQSTFSFIILRPGGIDDQTTINFTDNGWSTATNALGTTEGIITWKASGSLAQYTEVRITATGQATVTASASTGTATVSGFFILSAAGDQVLAFTGTAAAPTFISGIHMNSEINGVGGQPASTAATWDRIASANGPMGWTLTQNRSAIPQGLTNGTNAIMGVLTPGVTDAEFDNGRVDCDKAKGTSLSQIRTKIHDPQNWLFKDESSNPYPLPVNCTYLSTLPVGLGAVVASSKANVVRVKWTTISEQNNDHFEVQASTDGKTFVTLGTVNSKAVNGNSNQVLSYDFSADLAQHKALTGMALLSIFGIPMLIIRRKQIKMGVLTMFACLGLLLVSCSKNNEELNMADKKDVFIRVMSLDKDGGQHLSSVVLAVPDQNLKK